LQPQQRLALRRAPAPTRPVDEAVADTVPVNNPGKATNSEAARVLTTSKNGRARTGLPSEEALNLVGLLSRRQKSPSMPNSWQSTSQPPRVTRTPDRRSEFTSDPPNSTTVPGTPSTPARAWGVPAGLAVTRGGREAPFTHHRR